MPGGHTSCYLTFCRNSFTCRDSVPVQLLQMPVTDQLYLALFEGNTDLWV